MDLNFNNETIMVRDSAERFLKDKCPSSAVRELILSKEGYSKALWKEIADLGWLGYVYDEKFGGTGGSFFDLYVIFEQLGKYLFPSPFFASSVLSGSILNDYATDEMKNKYLNKMIAGEIILTTAATDSEGSWNPAAPALEYSTVKPGKYVINGTSMLIPYVHVADSILIAARTKKGESSSGSVSMFIIDKPFRNITYQPLHTISGEKKFKVDFKDVELTNKDVIGDIGEASRYLERIFTSLIVLKCGEILGGLERVCSMTFDYMKEREQFGGPLGRLQVVQHYCADMVAYLEGTRLLVRRAASLLDQKLPCKKEVYMAKAWASDAYKKATWIAHQLHGGIGFTEEHDLHLYYQHAKVSELEFGDAAAHRGKLAAEMGI